MTVRPYRRTGIFLVELVAMLSILALLGTVLWPLLDEIILVNSSTAHVVNCMVTQDDLVDQIRRDFEHARSLPETLGNVRSGDSCLLIGQKTAVVRYTFDAEMIAREILPTNLPTSGPSHSHDRQMWTLPKTNVRFTVGNLVRTRDRLIVEFETQVRVRTGKNETRNTRYELLLP